jgi:hypothetical protein
MAFAYLSSNIKNPIYLQISRIPVLQLFTNRVMLDNPVQDFMK